MTAEVFLNGKVSLRSGDCLDVLKTLEANSVDSIVTDPPYHLTTNKKGGTGTASINLDSPYGRARIGTGNGAGGFMGKAWDGGDIAFRVELWTEALRVLKPGGHLAAFGGTRTYHRMACAIEDAGFEIRDMLSWLYGSGFPKSHDVSKAIDKAAGAVRVATGIEPRRPNPRAMSPGGAGERTCDASTRFDKPATSAAIQWQGWGTALKPACEPICFGRKPLIGTVAENVLQWGTGAINVDGCRIKVGPGGLTSGGCRDKSLRKGFGYKDIGPTPEHPNGRWPANVIHDGSQEVMEAFPDAPGQLADVSLNAPAARKGNVYGKMNRHGEKSADARYHDKGSTNFAALPGMRRDDAGSAARFFYTAKADQDDRIGSQHPTVKPVDLMQWLVRLVTPPGGLVLDCFAGTGTTGEAAWREGMRATLIERETEYQDDIRRRMKLAMAGPREREHAIAKAKQKGKVEDLSGTLFAQQ